MSIIHFDFFPGVDTSFIQEGHIYRVGSFSDTYSEKDDSVEILTCMHTSIIDPHIRKCFPRLHTVVTRTVGVDHIDQEFCRENGIAFFAVGQYGPHVIATHAISMLLSGIRDLRTCRDMIQQGSYDYTNVHAIDLAGKKMGVIGVGHIGKYILRYAGVLGMELYGYDVYEDIVFQREASMKYVSLEEIYRTCDVICLACNLTQENKNMISEEAIKQMKNGVILINIARGELIDEDALLAFIDKFFYVGLDVIKDETNDGIRRFDAYKNILLTPHIAHYADSTVRNRWKKTYEIINNL